MDLERALAALTQARRRFITELEGLDEGGFSRVPPGETWSAAHIVEHLVRVETRVVRGSRHAVEKGSPVRPSPWDSLRKLPLRIGLAGLVRIRTVAGADPVLDPPAPLARAEQLERFAATRKATELFLAELGGRDLSRIWLRHPFFGAFTLPEMMRWMAWHEDRHRKQLARVRRALTSGRP
jgi:hypothetical protein